MPGPRWRSLPPLQQEQQPSWKEPQQEPFAFALPISLAFAPIEGQVSLQGQAQGQPFPFSLQVTPTPKIPLRLDCLLPFYFISCGSELTTAYGQVAQAFEV